MVAAGLYSAGFLAAIDAAMAVQPKQRPADHGEFRALMGDIEAPEAVSLAPRRDLMQEPFVGQATSELPVTVADRPAAPRTERAGSTVTSPPASEPKPPAVVRAVPVTAAAPHDAERSTHSWMKNSDLRSFGNRTLYGIVAGTCVLIGIAALVLQFATDPAPQWRRAPATPWRQRCQAAAYADRGAGRDRSGTGARARGRFCSGADSRAHTAGSASDGDAVATAPSSR